MDIIDIVENICIPLIAAFVGAILAFLYQRRSVTLNEERYILTILMAYRHKGITEEEFVKALNMSEIIFHKNRNVIEKLRQYSTYSSFEIYSAGQRVDAIFELILEMAKDVGYTSLKMSEVKDFFVLASPPPVKPESQIGKDLH